ncbi:MAG: bifunctional ADP-heptose synthase [Saprospiraceae bacterium]
MITKEELAQVRAKAKSIKAMVIGDAMLDRYIYGTVDRMSPEAPVPILSHLHTTLKAGGAANVALNLAAWGCRTSLAGLVGKDDHATTLKSLLEDHQIHHKLISVSNRPTTVKTRVVASSHHLLRIDEESSEYIYGEEETEVTREIMSFIKDEQPALIILQDYNKGLLTESLIKKIIDYCREHNVFVAVDPKEKNFLKYANVDLFKPNLREASYAAGKALVNEDLPELSKKWRNDHLITTIAVTLGSQGIFLQDETGECTVKPGRSVDIVDVCGAGDAVICSLALGLLTGLAPQKGGELANLTGAYVCSQSGVVAVNPDEIAAWLS